jgi:hypothetical protein
MSFKVCGEEILLYFACQVSIHTAYIQYVGISLRDLYQSRSKHAKVANFKTTPFHNHNNWLIENLITGS